MKNLNAEQIIKALECCRHSDSSEEYCADCPYYTVKYCAAKISEDTLSLIKELTEENANLHASCTEFEQKCASVKADTVRKMQEEVKARCRDLFSGLDVCMTVDQIAKEMLEGEK